MLSGLALLAVTVASWTFSVLFSRTIYIGISGHEDIAVNLAIRTDVSYHYKPVSEKAHLS